MLRFTVCTVIHILLGGPNLCPAQELLACQEAKCSIQIVSFVMHRGALRERDGLIFGQCLSCAVQKVTTELPEVSSNEARLISVESEQSRVERLGSRQFS